MPMPTSTRTANRSIRNICPDQDHDVRVSAHECGRCKAVLCDICMSDEHSTSDGHDLSDPRYWGV